SIGGAGSGSAQIINNTIIGNGGGGIGMNASDGTPIIRNNLISGNSCSRGGGIYMINGSSPLIVQNVIVNNVAESAGGGIYWLVPLGDPGPVVVNNTIVGNFSPEGSGVYADGYDESAELTNNLIIARPGLNAIGCGDNPPIINSNDIYSSLGPAYTGICTDQTGLNGNISVDPLFVDIASDDYRLDPESPVIDVGDSTEPNLPATDIAGSARIVGAGVDMGAYEFTPNPGYLEFSASVFTTNESDSNAVITIKRKAGKTGEVTVDFSTSDVDASAGSDYTTTSGTITFSEGDMADNSFTVPIIDDGRYEPSEEINLVLSNPTGGATLGTASTAMLQINDNDSSSSSRRDYGDREEDNSGCFISTAAYRSLMLEEVE
ncbi:MAG: hypothetical protein HKM93_08485, partial [Desulfobacteraceae bacterium]|nr:hypothetical protein [Desulfobacteraceae bacterium]